MKHTIDSKGDVKWSEHDLVTSPLGEAEWAHLVTPDTKFNVEGDFKSGLILKGDDALALKSQIDEAKQHALEVYTEAAEAAKKPGKRAKVVKLSEINPYEEQEEDGTYVFKLKRKASYIKDDGEKVMFEIDIYDASGAKQKGEDKAAYDNIGNGTIMRARFHMVPYNMATAGVGISLRLKDVQIKELVEYQSGGPGFDSIEDGDGGYSMVDSGVNV